MTARPLRIRLRRTKGWRMPPDTVKVDRSTKWGNPFVVHSDRGPSGKRWPMAPEVSVSSFRSMLTKEGAWFPVPLPWPKGKIPAGDPTTVADVKRELRGKNLACFCKLCPHHEAAGGKPLLEHCPDCAPCHCDVLGELAARNIDALPAAAEGG